MSGQPTPPRISEAFAINAPSVAAPNGTAGAKTNPFPAPSQTGVTNGAASLNDGFPPLTMTDPTSGGVAPFGEDMNGILYLISANVASLAAGQLPVFDADLAMAMSGYKIGAIVAMTSDPTAHWVNTVDGNADDPNSGTPGTAGWACSKPLYASVTPTTGSNYALPGPSDYILDVDTSAGAITLSGVVAQRDGQRVTWRKKTNDANIFTLAEGAGAAGNQIQYVGDLTMAAQYATYSTTWNATLNAWVVA